jgi:hypothetical protein
MTGDGAPTSCPIPGRTGGWRPSPTGLGARLFAAFLADIANGDLSLYPVDDARYEAALQLIGAYPDHSLRILDALHLGVAQHLRAACPATADVVMADAARALGFDVKRF